jgi:hydroxyacylglutathione hydrolase
MSGFAKTEFGPLKVIPGENGSRFPFSSTLFIDDDVKVVIDTGAGSKAMRELKEKQRIDMVINTHYHFDHMAYNYLFDESKILINDREAECYRDRSRIGFLLGMVEVYGEEWADAWLDRIANPDTEQTPYSPQNNHKWWLSSARVDEEYSWGDIIDFGRTKAHVIGTPGHSEGFCCMYFPDLGVAYVADFDLTAFGPWYGGTDGDIDLFIESCRNIAQLDAKYFITGHEIGILEKNDFKIGLDKYLHQIEKRDSLILSKLSEPLTLEDVADMGLIYGKKFHEDAWVAMWNHLMTKKNLLRLVRNGKVKLVDNKYQKQ